jgi:hypothetical protein
MVCRVLCPWSTTGKWAVCVFYWSVLCHAGIYYYLNYSFHKGYRAVDIKNIGKITKFITPAKFSSCLIKEDNNRPNANQQAFVYTAVAFALFLILAIIGYNPSKGMMKRKGR